MVKMTIRNGARGDHAGGRNEEEEEGKATPKTKQAPKRTKPTDTNEGEGTRETRGPERQEPQPGGTKAGERESPRKTRDRPDGATPSATDERNAEATRRRGGTANQAHANGRHPPQAKHGAQAGEKSQARAGLTSSYHRKLLQCKAR